MGTNKKSTWKTVNEGTFAGIKGLGTLDPTKREMVLRFVEQGRVLFIGGATAQAISLGRVCALIRREAGNSTFIQLVEQFWLEGGQSYTDVERQLQICQQMYHFSRRKGLKLPTDIPKDSYLRLANHVKSIKGKRNQNAAIASLIKERRLDGVDIGDSKALRHAVKLAKQAREKDSFSSDKYFESQVSQAMSDFKRVVSTIGSVTQKALSSIPKNPTDRERVSSRLLELRETLKIVKPAYRDAIAAISEATRQCASKKKPEDDGW